MVAAVVLLLLERMSVVATRVQTIVMYKSRIVLKNQPKRTLSTMRKRRQIKIHFLTNLNDRFFFTKCKFIFAEIHELVETKIEVKWITLK